VHRREVNATKPFASTSYSLTYSPAKLDDLMELRRLKLLLELSRLGSMRAVAEELGYTTSSVSQQLAVLAQEAGATLIEPDGRRVRLTPAGRRLAEHAVAILAAVDAARLDLDPAAEPRGTVRVAGFASAMRRSLLPLVDQLRSDHPDVVLRIREHEPDESFALLADDDIDLALVYDYNLAPLGFDPSLRATPLWSVPWALGVPSSLARSAPSDSDAPTLFREFAETPWIVNSRNVADEQAVRTIASMAGFQPDIAHHVDSLELVQELIVAGFGVGLLPADQKPMRGVSLVPVRDPDVTLRSYAALRRGRENWPPLALVARELGG
jgi:DNA-binding transcriptional LysR family regulator